jgi:hypothetical protein
MEKSRAVSLMPSLPISIEGNGESHKREAADTLEVRAAEGKVRQNHQAGARPKAAVGHLPEGPRSIMIRCSCILIIITIDQKLARRPFIASLI